MKISIIGAGNAGSALAERVLSGNLADVVLVDIVKDLAKAKSLDLLDAAPLAGYKKRIVGTTGYEETSGSGLFVITAGFPRRPGISRDDLIGRNAEIVRGVIKNINSFSAHAIIVVVTNPLDVMTYLAYSESGRDRRKVLGMAGSLDTARFKTLLSLELGVSHEKIETFVLGSHGDTMVPLVSKTQIDGKPLEAILDRERLEKILERTKKRGGEIVDLLKSGSAYFSPSAACFEILQAIINDEKKVIPCSCVLEGEYGIRDCAIGVPARIGKLGVEEVLEWDLPDNELNALRKSAKAVEGVIKCKKRIG